MIAPLPHVLCGGDSPYNAAVACTPERDRENPCAGFSALTGFLFMFLSNDLIKRRTGEATLAFGVTAAEGIGIHSLVDGGQQARRLAAPRFGVRLTVIDLED